MDRSICRSRRWFVALGFGIASTLTIAPVQGQQPCGSPSVIYPFPYTDVGSVGTPFCPGIMEAYVTGVTKGTTPTTFSPNETVTRVQMTTFLQRSLDQGLTRASRRAGINQWSTPQNTNAMQTISPGGSPFSCASDGENVWTSTETGVVQVQASTGKVLGTWTGATASFGEVVAAGMVFVLDNASPQLYVIDPTMPPGVLTSIASLPAGPVSIAFDGANLWTANLSGSVSMITPQSPYTVTTVTTGFSQPVGIVYTGANIWVTDTSAGKLFKLNSSGGIVQAVTVGAGPTLAAFDGANIWVTNNGDSSITVVQASTGNVVNTINSDASNQLNGPQGVSFDGDRILVTNLGNASVTVFKAADLSFIANVSTGDVASEACSDGTYFWLNLPHSGKMLRF
jgi:hypothetical protein